MLRGGQSAAALLRAGQRLLQRQAAAGGGGGSIPGCQQEPHGGVLAPLAIAAFGTAQHWSRSHGGAASCCFCSSSSSSRGDARGGQRLEQPWSMSRRFGTGIASCSSGGSEQQPPEQQPPEQQPPEQQPLEQQQQQPALAAAAAAAPPKPPPAAAFGPRKVTPMSSGRAAPPGSVRREGVVHVNSTFNNTIIVLTDRDSKVKTWTSGGTVGYKNANKATPMAAELAAKELARRALDMGFHSVVVKLKGMGKNKQFAVQSLAANGLTVTQLQDVTPIPYNGCRLPRRRRV